MILVSQQFKDAICSPARKTSSKVIFQIVDTTASPDASAVVTGEASISRKSQLFDSFIYMSGKYATFENDYWKLDGSFVLPPEPSEVGYEVGWWSAELSRSDGVFTNPQVLTITFTEDHSSVGLTMLFDVLANEYASDFTVTAYDVGNNIISTSTVTGNTLSKYILQQGMANYRKIIITIAKWCNGYRRARVNEVSFGIVDEYSGDELIGVNILEDFDPISSQVSSNELKFTLDNQDKRFNILNPTGIYPYLQRRQKILAYLGVETVDGTMEYAPMGSFYLSEWKSDEGTLTASFTGRDMLDILSQDVYRKGIYQTRSLYDLAVDVLTDAGVSFYSIDPALQLITVTGYLPLVSYRDALQIIAIAGMAVVYCDRSGYVTIKQLQNTPLLETIDFDNVYSPPLIKLASLVNKIDIPVYSYNPQGSASQVYSGSLNINGTQEVWIEYSSAPAQGVTAAVTGGVLNSATYYSNAALLNITASGLVTITATGTVLDASSYIYTLLDSNIPAGEQALPGKVDNPLIVTNTIAANVASWILAELKKRFLYEINWRMNPAFVCGDIVTSEDEFGENKTIRITRQEFQFAGYLGGKTNGKGGGS